jgi:hypothetical protein
MLQTAAAGLWKVLQRGLGHAGLGVGVDDRKIKLILGSVKIDNRS